VWVTVHADISYSSVSSLSVTLNGVPVTYTKSDARGDLVAKFVDESIKGIVAPGNVQLTLSGTTKSGDSFSGTDTVRVVTVSGKK
jgi:hypothetical protein